MAIIMSEAEAAVEIAAGEYLAGFSEQRRPGALRSLLNGALALLNQYHPRKHEGSLTLQVGVQRYPAPPGLVDVLGTDYGQSQLQAANSWEFNLLRQLPKVYLASRDGLLFVALSHAPDAPLIAHCGPVLNYCYSSLWSLDYLPPDALPLIEKAVLVEVAGRRIFSDTQRTLGDGHKNRTQESARTAHQALKADFLSACQGAPWLR